MLASDLLMDHRFSWMTLVIYGCMAAGTAIGQCLAQDRTSSRTFVATMAGSVLFYVVTNFAVWAGSTRLYAHTVEGLVQCYVLALPFFRNSLAGDLFWTAALFSLHHLAVMMTNANGSPIIAASQRRRG